MNKVLIIQTSFLGDVILTLPIAQALKSFDNNIKVTFLVIPEVKNALENNLFVDEILVYDKRKLSYSLKEFFKIIRTIKERNFDTIVCPHRSLRSALITRYSGVQRKIGFDSSATTSYFTDVVSYRKEAHEIIRNLSLLAPLGIIHNEILSPKLFPSEEDKKFVANVLKQVGIREDEKIVAIAPGSVWFTKRFPEYKFTKLLDMLKPAGVAVVLVGGKDDEGLCGMIRVKTKNYKTYNLAGKLTVLQTAELLKRAAVLITNDSAPLHIGNAMGTRVIAIFGSTVPEFGFYPYGSNDVIFQILNLPCRPCGIHGRRKCPIKTFDCMTQINEMEIVKEIQKGL
ncbi:MAG: glycosyltransferase family 9 protein [Ignavibacteria bacterium]